MLLLLISQNYPAYAYVVCGYSLLGELVLDLLYFENPETLNAGGLVFDYTPGVAICNNLSCPHLLLSDFHLLQLLHIFQLNDLKFTNISTRGTLFNKQTSGVLQWRN